MARGLFPDLESPFLDEEVLPAPTPEVESRDSFEDRPDAGEAAALDEAGETAGAAGLADPELDEGEQAIDEAEQVIDEAEQAIDEGAAELEDTRWTRSARWPRPAAMSTRTSRASRSSRTPRPMSSPGWTKPTIPSRSSRLNRARIRTRSPRQGTRSFWRKVSTGPQASGGGTSTVTPAVTILLDEPLESDDKYQLVSKDKKYSKTLGPKDARPLVDGARRLTFSGVDAKKEYQLVQIRSTGSKRVILPMIPYKGLTEAGHRAPKAKYSYFTKPSQARRKLPDRYQRDQPVDPILVAASPVLVNLPVDDPKL